MNIDDAPETQVNFGYKTNSSVQRATTKDIIENIRVFESVTVGGLALFGDAPPEVTTGSGLRRLNGCFLDESGTMRLTLWNEQIDQVELNNQYYEMENMRVRQYLGEKYLSGSADSTFKKITLDVPHLSPENIKNA